MSDIPISLIKKRYASIAAAQGASGTTQGAIVFDKEHKVICVNGDVYGGNITDVVFNENHQLIISKADGTNVTLDFSDVASAQGTMTVFGQIRDVIGVDNNMSVQGQYASTHYLQGVQTLVDADKELDKILTQVQGQAEAAQGLAEQVQGQAEAAQGLAEQVQGQAEAAQGLAEQVQGEVETLQDQVDALQQAVIDNENVTVQAVEAIQKATGLTNQLQYVLPQTAWATQGANSMAEAIAQLDTQVQGMKTSEKSYTMVQSGTTSQGALKSYQLQEVVGNSVTNVGVPIDIPKDFLVKSATVETVQEADVPYEGAEVGDKYIDFVINVKEGTAQDEHLYIPVDDLMSAISVQQNAPRVQLHLDDHNQLSAEIVAGSIGSDELASQAVQQANIANSAVGSDQLANQAVQQANIANSAVGSDQLANNAVQQANIADDAVGSDQLADLAVQTANIANQGVTAEKIAAQGVQGWNIAQGAITSDKLADELVQVDTNTPEIKVNDPENAGATQGVTIATVGGKEIKAKVGMYWSEWSDDEPTPEP